MSRTLSSVRNALVLGTIFAGAATWNWSLYGQSSTDTLLRHLLEAEARPDRGQTVAPVFEGWEPNPDGTFRLYFGYMNRNWNETLDIPVGPSNYFEPGPQDRSQPTHFLSRRHKQTFFITVPKDFGQQTLVWTLSIRGSTEKVTGSLRPDQQADISRDSLSGNTRPSIEVAAAETATVGKPYKLVATVSDDGLPKARASNNPRATLNVQWSKYRGPGQLQFASAVTPVEGQTASTTVVFSEPGEYMIQALADDGSILATSQGQNVPGYGCCWTTDHIKVSVSGAGQK